MSEAILNKIFLLVYFFKTPFIDICHCSPAMAEPGHTFHHINGEGDEQNEDEDDNNNDEEDAITAAAVIAGIVLMM